MDLPPDNKQPTTIEALQQQVAELARSVRDVLASSGKLSNPPDQQTVDIMKKAANDFLPDTLIDLMWDNIFYYHNYFESLDGWSLANTGVATGITGAGVTLETGAVIDNETSIVKFPEIQNVLTFDQRSRFRSSFELLSNSANMEFNVTYGFGANGMVFRHYGFRVQGGQLLGVTANGTAESTVVLLPAVQDSDRYVVEARLFPGNKVVFLVTDAAGTLLKERGVLTTNLPKGDVHPADDDGAWFHFLVRTKAAAAKSVYFDFAEYIQEKIISR